MIFALLAGLGYWGHRHHWKMPRFSELRAPWGAETIDARNGSGAREGQLAGGLAAGSPSGGMAGGRQSDAAEARLALPIVRFVSHDAVYRAGIRIESAQVGGLDEFIIANGEVNYDETRLAQLSSRTEGIAWRVDKSVGDPVHMGEVLAILDSSEVGKSKADLLEATVNFQLKHEMSQRLQKARSAVPGASVSTAEAEAKLARVRLFNAEQTLINLGLPLPGDWEDELSIEERAKRIQFLGLPDSIVDNFGVEVVTANLISLTAPFDGVVIRREIVTGEVVQIGHPQFVIADVSRMWLTLSVRKADAHRLALGQEVWFASKGLFGEVHSRLSWIATEVDEKTRTVGVRAEVDNPPIETRDPRHEGQRLLRAHSFGTARIRVRDEGTAVVVPNGAVQTDGGRFVVFVPLADGRSFQPRLVAVGVRRDGLAEIVEGLGPGERVAVSGSYILKAEMGREQANED
ncbi:MAG TPA: efflux RND transporter periplasmic adaptor subunit [Planctomycetaceae bacterium]|nr:efflux RND transporter periplasmic adaptor subunit [Planctomycetaceae bacterium]